jgi:hypothetical protein
MQLQHFAEDRRNADEDHLRFFPPDKFKAVYTINTGTTLVGVMPDTRVPIANIGDTASCNAAAKDSATVELS